MLGHETATREHEAEPRAIGSEAQVVVEDVRNAEPGGHAVHGGDHWLGEAERVAVLAAEERRERGGQLDVEVVAGSLDRSALDALQHVHVGAGAVALPCPRDDDRPHRRVAIGAEGGVAHLGAEPHRPGVQLLRPVERDRRDAIGDVVEDLAVVRLHESGLA